jgi:hypothetical protein
MVSIINPAREAAKIPQTHTDGVERDGVEQRLAVDQFGQVGVLRGH